MSNKKKRRARREGLKAARDLRRILRGANPRPVKEPKPLPTGETCYFEGCSKRATAKHECLTCGKLVAAGKKAKGGDGTVFTVCACPLHSIEGIEVIRQHVFVKHPSNMVRIGLEVLKGNATLPD